MIGETGDSMRISEGEDHGHDDQAEYVPWPWFFKQHLPEISLQPG